DRSVPWARQEGLCKVAIRSLNFQSNWTRGWSCDFKVDKKSLDPSLGFIVKDKDKFMDLIMSRHRSAHQDKTMS
ncbi:hypothetical protein BGZ95_007900, partial [Linnemannia exigua]